LGAHRVVKIKSRRWVRAGVVSRENRNHDAGALEDEPEIVAQQFRERAHFPVDAHLLQLGAPEKLERMLEDARHFPRRRRHSRDRHDGMPVDLENFIGAIVDDGIPRRGAAIAGDEHAAQELKSQDRGGLGERNFGPRRDSNGTHRTHWTCMPHAPQQPNEIIGATSASGSIHHWPVRWR
jgi:hypothetical protein